MLFGAWLFTDIKQRASTQDIAVAGRPVRACSLLPLIDLA